LDTLDKDTAKKDLRTIWIIWSAIFLSLWLYIVVCHELVKEVPYVKGYDASLELLKYVFFALSLIALYLSHRLRKTMMERSSVKSDLRVVERTRQLGKSPTLVKYMMIVLVSVALSEGVTLLGVVYFFLSGDFQTLYVLLGLSAIAMIYHRPKADELATVTLASEATGRS
jgi:hypothetical protein